MVHAVSDVVLVAEESRGPMPMVALVGEALMVGRNPGLHVVSQAIGLRWSKSDPTSPSILPQGPSALHTISFCVENFQCVVFWQRSDVRGSRGSRMFYTGARPPAGLERLHLLWRH